MQLLLIHGIVHAGERNFFHYHKIFSKTIVHTTTHPGQPTSGHEPGAIYHLSIDIQK